MEEDKFPELEETTIRLKELKEITLTGLNSNPLRLCKEWLGAYYKIFPKLPVRKKIIESKDFDVPLYRASIQRDGFNENLLFEYTYPPKSKSSLGRCNFPGYPVLYSSLDPLIAVKEIISEGEIPAVVYLSRWKVIPSKEQFVIQEFMPENLPTTNPYFNKNNHIKVGDIFPDFLKSDSQKKAYLEVVKEFYNSFISTTDYNYASIFSHISFFRFDGGSTDMILYPSVKDLDQINAAIAPNFVDNQMQIDRIYILNVFRNSINISHFSEVKNNKVVFIKREDNQDRFQHIFSEDFPGFLLTQTGILNAKR